MLKTKPLNQLLSQSTSPNVSSALLFTPSGSLLATSTSPIASDAKKSRTHAALAANIWSAYERAAVEGAIEQSLPNASVQQVADSAARPPPNGDAAQDTALKSLTLELSDHNLHIQAVSSRVLLCLIGPQQPTRHASSSSSLHSQDAEARASPQGSLPKSGDSASGGGGGSSGGGSPAAGSVRGPPPAVQAAGGSLGILKTQAQALVAYLEKELKGFELPEGI